MRGQFIRGFDNGAGVDPDATSRINGDTVGSTQGHATAIYDSLTIEDAEAHFHSGSTSTDGAHTHEITDFFYYDADDFFDEDELERPTFIRRNEN